MKPKSELITNGDNKRNDELDPCLKSREIASFSWLIISVLALISPSNKGHGQELGASINGTSEEENKYYKIVNIPIPPDVPMRPG